MADIKQIAYAILLSTYRDIDNIRKILRDEYGIEAEVTDDVKTLEAQQTDLESVKQQISVVQTRLKEEAKRREKPFVPRKIGKPRGFPKNMRRK